MDHAIIDERERRHRRALSALVRRTPSVMRMLEVARDLRLSSWCLGAGVIRTLVFDEAHGLTYPSRLPDVDLVYFDAVDCSRERDRAIERSLEVSLPGHRWEVVNQAGVHLWYPERFGAAIAPYRSIDDALSSWPETCTAVGIRLDATDDLVVHAPFGLDDLMQLVVRQNPRCVGADVFLSRVESKAWTTRWPRVRVVFEDDASAS